MALYELRQYEIRPGKMESWIQFMEREIVPYQVAKGMVVTGIFRGETDDSFFFWIRRFEDEAQREALYQSVYEDGEWEQRFKDRVTEHIVRETITVNRAIPTPKSVLQ